jgi:thymidylate kinase
MALPTQSPVPRPLFIVFEGPDGSGKTSLSTRVGSELRKAGRGATVAALPGRTPGSLGDLVYRIHHDPTSAGLHGLTPSALQALHIGAQLDAIETRLLPGLRSGESLILDRYWWSTWVYGRRQGVDAVLLDSLVATQASLWGGVTPDVIFLLHRSRSIHANVPVEEYRGIAAGYAQLAERESARQRVQHVDNEGAFEATLAAVLDTITTLHTTDHPES